MRDIFIAVVFLISCGSDDETNMLLGKWSYTTPDGKQSTFTISGKSPNYSISDLKVDDITWTHYQFIGVNGNKIQEIAIAKSPTEPEGMAFLGCVVSANKINVDSVLYQINLEKTMYYNQVISKN